MMKLLVQLCFLALITSAVSQGLNRTIRPVTPVPETSAPTQLYDTKTAVDVNKNATDPFNASTSETDVDGTMEETNNATASTPSPPAHQSPTSASVTTPKEESSEGSTSAAPTAVTSQSSSWAYILLVLIIIVIIALCVILYMLRRASRTYSFDLQRPPASSSAYEPTGTFGQVYLDDLDQPVNKDVISDDLSTTPIPNGTGPQPEENADGEENALQDPPEANDPQRSSSSSSSSSNSSSLLSGGDQTEKKSNQMSSNNLFFDAVEEPQQQNGNNNNPSVCSVDPFVEINLDDPAWSDQLLTSPPTSSVLPFSSFSFSSSSSSS